jgi:hypothetical protein
LGHMARLRKHITVSDASLCHECINRAKAGRGVYDYGS